MTAWLAETLAGTTFLMLVVLALRGPVASAFGARWAYALWAIPALRMVLPPLPALFPEAPLPPVVIFIPTTAPVAAPLPAASTMVWEWMPFLVALWAGGAVIFLTLQWLGYRDFDRRLAASARPARPRAYGSISILVSPEVDGPIALGLLHRRIVVPADFLRRYSIDEQRLAMEHELIHHRRGDLWWNLAALVVLACNWFNPVAWYAFRAFRSDQELACDAAVAARASLEERHDYASALVKSASRPGLIAACPLTRAGQLKHRLRMMRSHRISSLRSLGGGSALAALTAGAFAVGTPGFSHTPERQIVYMPAPEAAPARLASATIAPTASPSARTAVVREHRSHAVAARAAAPNAEARSEALASNAPVEASEVQLASASEDEDEAPEPAVRLLSAAQMQWRVHAAVVSSPAAIPVASAEAAPACRGAKSAAAPEGASEQRVQVIARLLDRLGVDGEDLEAVKAALAKSHGRVKVKILHTMFTENGA